MPSVLAASGADAGAAGVGAGAGAAAMGADSGTGVGAGAGAAAIGAGASAGGATGAGAAIEAAPASAVITANTVPTSTVSPSAIRISARKPAAGEDTSESTLSVETSKSNSSCSTRSPTFLNHLVIVPSVTVSPSWGMVTSDMAGLSMRERRCTK